jgi:hypothetical protein
MRVKAFWGAIPEILLPDGYPAKAKLRPPRAGPMRGGFQEAEL